ncbi:MAG: type II secretion system protein [Pseudohongiellaceae bacterium]
MLISNRKNYRTAASGFSILEMAIVMIIVGTLLGGLLVSISSTQELNNRTDADQTLEEIKEALYGFAQTNGRLPCPARATSNGAEDPIGGGVCLQRYGFVPWATLGLSGPLNADNLLMDSWLNPYRYSVTNIDGSAFTTPGQISLLSVPDLRVCSSAGCGAGTVLFDSAPAVVLSMGANWTTYTAADEVENAEATTAGYRQANDNDFVTTGYIEDAFDDIITWISPSILYTKMIAAGQLP